MKKKFVLRSINVKILVIFFLVSASLIALSCGTLYFLFSDVLRRQIMHDLDNIMTQNSWNMNTFVNSINQASLYLCTDKSVASSVSTDYADPLKRNSAVSDLQTEYSNHIYIPLNDVLKNYRSMFFVDESYPVCKGLSSHDSLDSAGTSGMFRSRSVSSADWYRTAYEKKGSFHSFILNGDKSVLYMARSVSNPYLLGAGTKNGFMGIEVFRLYVSEIGEKIETGDMTANTMVFLIDSDGTILYSKAEGDLRTNISRYMPVSMVRDSAGGSTDTLDYNGSRYIASIHTLKYNLSLVALIPEKDIYARMSFIRQIILLTALLTLLLGAVFIAIFSKGITQPIKKLAATMKSVRTCDTFDVSLTPPSDDEVGVLYESFNSMMSRINGLMDELVRTSRLQQEAELKALQAQINPHFLYNTLDSISWLALTENNDRIATMVSSLASIMRFNLRDPDKLVTISEELENVRNYVSIQQLRCAGRFDVEYCVAPELLTKKAPKLTLQPLVENSILHGTENISRKGCIRILGAKEGGLLVIRIEDNGAGADANELNARLNDTLPIRKKSDSIGIRNVHQRIRLHFGADFGLHYEPGPAGGIAAVVVLPFYQEEEPDDPGPAKPA